jgi:hypothetical protein
MIKKISILLGVVFAYATMLCAQYSGEVRVNDVNVRYVQNKVFVSYKILNGKETDRYLVWLEFYDAKNKKIEAKSLHGDFEMVTGNGDKAVSWDPFADGIILNENIHVQVNAKLVPQPNVGKAFGLSTLYPGTGHYQFKSDRPYWIRGTIAFGLMGGALGTFAMSNSYMDKYRATDLPSAEDQNYQSALQYRQASLIMAGVGLGIWLFDYAGLIHKTKKSKNLTTNDIILDSGYKLYSATSSAQMVNTRGMPPNLFAVLSFTDDNGNGILEAMESAEIKIVLSNRGAGNAQLLTVDVKGDKVDRSFLIKESNQKIMLLKPGESKEITMPIRTDINLVTNTHTMTINVKEHYGYDMDPAQLILNTYAYQPPKLVLSGHEIIDAGMGTMSIVSDGQLQAGERVKVKILIQNIGQSVAKKAIYQISTTDSNIFIDNVSGSLGDINPGEVKELFFDLSPNKRVTTKDNLPVFITVTEEIGRGSLRNERLPIQLDQKPPKANIVEIKSDIESLKKNVARFEYSSDKFRANITSIINVKNVAPSTTKRPKSVGVVIGVAQYKELVPAPYADNDAKIMKEYFEKVLGVEQVIMYTNDKVSGFFFDDIFNPELGELRKAVVKGESEVFVFYSGHGIPDKDGKNIYLFPNDGRISRLEIQGYNIEKLYENLNKLEAKHVTVILDACFSGASRSSVSTPAENLVSQKGVRVRPKYSWATNPGFTVITSSTGEETSLGFDETETGLFTYFLSAGLQGKADSNNDKIITLGELRDYVTANVVETSTRILGKQTPIFFGSDERIMATY